MKSYCEAEWPFSVSLCGGHGTCTEERLCVCDPGWRSVGDYFTHQEGQSGLCVIYEPAVQILWTIAAIVGFFAMLHFLYVSIAKDRARRTRNSAISPGNHSATNTAPNTGPASSRKPNNHSQTNDPSATTTLNQPMQFEKKVAWCAPVSLSMQERTAAAASGILAVQSSSNLSAMLDGPLSPLPAPGHCLLPSTTLDQVVALQPAPPPPPASTDVVVTIDATQPAAAAAATPFIGLVPGEQLSTAPAPPSRFPAGDSVVSFPARKTSHVRTPKPQQQKQRNHSLQNGLETATSSSDNASKRSTCQEWIRWFQTPRGLAVTFVNAATLLLQLYSMTRAITSRGYWDLELSFDMTLAISRVGTLWYSCTAVFFWIGVCSMIYNMESVTVRTQTIVPRQVAVLLRRAKYTQIVIVFAHLGHIIFFACLPFIGSQTYGFDTVVALCRLNLGAVSLVLLFMVIGQWHSGFALVRELERLVSSTATRTSLTFRGSHNQQQQQSSINMVAAAAGATRTESSTRSQQQHSATIARLRKYLTEEITAGLLSVFVWGLAAAWPVFLALASYWSPILLIVQATVCIAVNKLIFSQSPTSSSSSSSSALPPSMVTVRPSS